MKYFIVGDEDSVLGFGMVWVEGRVAETAAEAEAAFRAALELKEIGIIVITERAAELIRPVLDPYVLSRRFPLVVEIPDRRGPVPGRKSVREMVTEAIGIKL
jgi:V/A-type H+/Na+-transporting ATPase subunit F